MVHNLKIVFLYKNNKDILCKMLSETVGQLVCGRIIKSGPDESEPQSLYKYSFGEIPGDGAEVFMAATPFRKRSRRIRSPSFPA